MSLQVLTGIIRENLYMGIAGVLFLGIIMFIVYFVIYMKLLGGKIIIPRKQLLVGGLLVVYIIMVIGVTFLNRGTRFQLNMNLHFLSSYREAWNNFSLRHWQFVILNIVMFVPLGILLPLFHKNFRKAGWTIGVGMLSTLIIESLQLITGRGSFVLDDIFNNSLGAIIGYGIVMGVLTIINGQRKRFYKAMGYFSPLLIVTLTFMGIFFAYNLQEFGNLAIAHSYSINMNSTQVNLSVHLNDERTSNPIYQAPVHSKYSAKDFAVEFMENLDIDTSNLEVIAYSTSAIYWSRGNPSYNMKVNYLDGSYSFSDFSSFDKKPVEAEEEVLIEELRRFGIEIPEGAMFSNRDTRSYEWVVHKKTPNNKLIDGVLYISYYNDGTIKQINNTIVEYNKVRNVPTKSEKEAYQEILDGNFFWYPGNGIETINVHEVQLMYHLDSKGFYQPVYFFYCTIDGFESRITIPALLR
ncbi:VanZ family protein [Alkalicella caledoniensis]|uniref:VanZ family protein n=1 Tax=Alkalicella caledoniensis TaxID=2731377 RepID=A0A7G9WCA2_ALKCA|nr:VanZ family protein [Alkalicella caledoniensis]QNO16314.1 VanZ family protein [Alkalicella caledoniensis]